MLCQFRGTRAHANSSPQNADMQPASPRIPVFLNHVEQHAVRRRTRLERREPIWRAVTRVYSAAFRAAARRRVVLAPALLLLCVLAALKLAPMHRARRTTLEIIDFAPSRVDQPTARVYYKTGTVQTIPLHAESERPTRLWQTDIERISVPPGCGLQGLDAGDRRTTFERGVNETCAGGICEGLTMASFMCFAALAVHQIVQLGAPLFCSSCGLSLTRRASEQTRKRNGWSRYPHNIAGNATKSRW